MVGVEEQQEGVVANRVTVAVRVGQRIAVEGDGERLGEAGLPVFRSHLGAVRPEPAGNGCPGNTCVSSTTALDYPHAAFHALSGQPPRIRSG
jgi:hypothetical protein